MYFGRELSHEMLRCSEVHTCTSTGSGKGLDARAFEVYFTHLYWGCKISFQWFRCILVRSELITIDGSVTGLDPRLNRDQWSETKPDLEQGLRLNLDWRLRPMSRD